GFILPKLVKLDQIGVQEAQRDIAERMPLSRFGSTIVFGGIADDRTHPLPRAEHRVLPGQSLSAIRKTSQENSITTKGCIYYAALCGVAVQPYSGAIGCRRKRLALGPFCPHCRF